MVENEALCNKEKINEHLDSVKLKDLKFLKQQNGPFTKAEEQEQFIKKKSKTDKVKRLYTEKYVPKIHH